MLSSAALVPDIQPRAVLDFWFSPSGDSITTQTLHRPWLGLGPDWDSEVSRLFGPALTKALAGGLKDWESESESRLALIILLDQLPRHAWRGQVQSLAGDERAIRLARSGWRRGYFEPLSGEQKIAVLMPLLRSESLNDQDLAAEFLSQLPPSPKQAQCLRLNALQTDQLQRFDRLTLRNELLGRADTLAETQWLAGQDLPEWNAG